MIRPSREESEDERAGGDADRPRLDDRADVDGRGDVVAIGQSGERDVGAGDAEDDQRQQPFRAPDVAGREHRLGEDHQDRARDRRGDEGGEQPVRDDADMGLVGGRKLLGEAALQPHRGELGGELDDDHRISEAAEQLRPVEAAGDEQEGQARGEPQHEAEEVGPPALRQRGDVRVGRGRFRHPDSPGRPGAIKARGSATVPPRPGR